jgi:hypothetical protein
MLELIAIALFQAASITGTPTASEPYQAPATTISATETSSGSGGWGNDMNTDPIPDSGSGGWGND